MSPPASTMPPFVAPMLATPGVLPADDDQWAFEFKWDGIRAIGFIRDGVVRFSSRRNNDLTSSVPELLPEAGLLDGLGGIVDGEIVALDPCGVPRFQLLQNRARDPGRLSPSGLLAYIVFDVLWLDGRSLLNDSYTERRAVLEALELHKVTNWTVAPSFPGRGEDVYAASLERQLEGVVAKRLSSHYVPGRRSPAWIKVKHERVQAVVIGGWTRGEGSRGESIGALLLGVPDDNGLAYAGKVGSGFDERELRQLSATFAGLVAEHSPFSTAVPPADVRVATWLRPILVGEVSFLEWTNARRLRAPVWRGLRFDKSPEDVRRP